MKNRETVCDVVVTYNRKKLLKECLEALIKQTRPIQAIYLIDNASTDGTPNLLLEKGYIKELPPKNLSNPWEKEFEIKNLTDEDTIKLYYVRMHENTGGAGGFHEGVKRGYEKGYDWLWLMDDDVEPLPYAHETMMKYADISKCIHPSKEYINGDRFFWAGYIDEQNGFALINNEDFIYNKEWITVNYGCFEGMLLHKDVIEKIGYPDKKLFFIGDDTIYGYKSSQYTNNLYIKDVCFIKKIDKRGKDISRLYVYLYSRNILAYVSKKIAKNKFKWFVMSNYKLIRMQIHILKSLQFIKIKDSFNGYIDGLREKWGKEKRYLK